MKVQPHIHNIERIGVSEATRFKIKHSAKAFNILYSNLYSNKHVAILRELALNAYDSHVSAGCKNRPIEIVLPSFSNPVLSVIDYGVSLDHNEVMTLYTTFFDSTKTDTNELVGQLGLGSKAPFCMFKIFTLETRKNGKRRTYTAFLDEEGIPSVALMGEEDDPTCENGVTVSMRVDPADVQPFSEAASTTFVYFDVQPKFIGTSAHWKPRELSYLTKTEDYGFLAQNDVRWRPSSFSYLPAGLFVIQGMVAYPVDYSIVQRYFTKQEYRSLNLNEIFSRGIRIDLFANIGDVDIAPSREALSYDKRTCEFLAAKIEKMFDQIYNQASSAIEQCNTLYEATVTYVKLIRGNIVDEVTRSIVSLLDQEAPFTWRTQKLDYCFTFTNDKLIDTSVVVGTYEFGRFMISYRTTDPTVSGTIQCTESIKIAFMEQLFFVLDAPLSMHTTIRTYCREHRIERAQIFILKAAGRKTAIDEKAIEHFKSLFGHPPLIRFSQLRKSTPTSDAENPRTYEGTKVYVYDNNTCSSSVWSQTTVDLNDITTTRYYVNLHRTTVIHNDRTVVNLGLTIAAAVGMGILPKDVTVYGVNSKLAPKITKKQNWVNVLDYISKRVSDLELPLIRAARAVFSSHFRGSEIVAPLRTITEQFPHNVIASFAPLLEATEYLREIIMHAKKGSAQISSHLLFEENLQKEAQLSEQMWAKLGEYWNAIVTRYPMLRYVDWEGRHMSEKDIEQLVNYIKLVESNNR